MDSRLFEDQFNVSAIDPDGKSFQRVSRLVAQSNNNIEAVIDYNSDLFKPQVGAKLEMLLTKSLADDQTPDVNPQYNPRLQSKLLDEYEYVMFGKVFKIKQPTSEPKKTEVFISYGGLLMSLSGPPDSLREIELDAQVYLLIRKAT